MGAAARPADVSRPAVLSSSHRFRLISDHLLLGCRGVTLRRGNYQGFQDLNENSELGLGTSEVSGRARHLALPA